MAKFLREYITTFTITRILDTLRWLGLSEMTATSIFSAGKRGRQDRAEVAESKSQLSHNNMTFWQVFNMSLFYDHDAFTMSAPFSPIMITGAFMLPLVMVGMIDASITLKPVIP